MLNIESAPEFTLPDSALQQPVAWAQVTGLISLREFIAFHGTDRTREAFGILPEEAMEPVKKVDELTDQELMETVCARLRIGTDENSRIAIVDQGNWSIDEIIEQVREGISSGPRILEADRRNIGLLESLIEAGKLTGPGEPKPLRPDFPF